MLHRYSFWRFLLTLFLVGLLIAGGVALYQAGFGQGYQAALAAGVAGSDGVTHLPAYGYFWPPFAGFGFPFFFPFGIFLGIGFFLFVFFVLGVLFRFAGRRRWNGRNGPYGWRHGWEPYGDRPPEAEKNKNDQTL